MLPATTTTTMAVEGRQCPNRFFGLMSLRRFFQPILSSRRKRNRNNKQKNDRNVNNQTLSNEMNEEGHNPTQINSIGILQHESSSLTSNECPLCIEPLASSCLSDKFTCRHRVCDACLLHYLCVEIDESRINLKCPSCDVEIHPNVIYETLKLHADESNYIRKYEQFMLRRVLITEQDARWCPAPDCNYIVIASGCASCPSLQCARPECQALFCYHCKQTWHPDQTCISARAQRRKKSPRRSTPTPSQSDISSSSDGSRHSSFHLSSSSSSRPANSQNNKTSGKVRYVSTSNVPDSSDLKPCPNCGILIFKMNDGSCNHMTCTVCLTEFCWLCMKRISDLHYLSPSGCTFWGKKPWSRKKKIFWQIGMLIGAPVGIALIAGIAIPTIVVGIPVWFGRKLQASLISQSVGKRKRTLLVTSGVISSIIVSPFVAAIVVGIGVPVMLTYVYGVVPLTLVRSGGCGLSTSASGVRIEVNEEPTASFQSSQIGETTKTVDLSKATGVSNSDTMADVKSTTNVSIGEFSMSSHCAADAISDSFPLDVASTVGMMGSHVSTEPKSSK